MGSAWRIVKKVRVPTAFNGEGARLHGGRWNSPGTAMVYTAQEEALAVLEILVHLQASDLLSSYALIPLTFADRLVEIVDPNVLRPDWRRAPAPAALRCYGDRWATERRSVVLRVPSVLVETEFNYLLNPLHPTFQKVRIGTARSFRLDPRLLGRRRPT